MGAVFSKIQDPSNLKHIDYRNLIRLWLKNTYFRVAIVTITFLIARRIYNNCHRIWYSLPSNGDTGLPIVGCIPYLLLNIYAFMRRMSEYGEVVTYNLGFKTITLINDANIAKGIINAASHPNIHNNNGDEQSNIETNELWKQRRNFVESIITEELNSKLITECIKTYIEKNIHFRDNDDDQYNEDGHEEKENYQYDQPPNKPILIRKHMKSIIFNIMMIACFGTTMAKSKISDEFYEKWDDITTKIRDHALHKPLGKAIFGQSLYGFFSKLMSKRKNKSYIEEWEEVFAQYIQDNIVNDTNIMNNHESLFSKMYRAYAQQHIHCGHHNACGHHHHHHHHHQHNLEGDEMNLAVDKVTKDLFVIMANAMDTTSASLEWCIMSLCQYPLIQEQIYTEIKGACQGNINNINLDKSYISNLSVLKAFIYDNLRLYPLGSLPRFRTNSTGKPIRVKLSNGEEYHIPPDGLYHINMYGMTRMKANWDPNNKIKDLDLDKINLSLWQDDQGKFLMNNASSSFGFGTRNCIGKVFAIKALQLILSLLVFKYSFNFEDGHKMAKGDKLKYNKRKTYIVPSPEIGIKIQLRDSYKSQPITDPTSSISLQQETRSNSLSANNINAPNMGSPTSLTRKYTRDQNVNASNNNNESFQRFGSFQTQSPQTQEEKKDIEYEQFSIPTTSESNRNPLSFKPPKPKGPRPKPTPSFTNPTPPLPQSQKSGTTSDQQLVASFNSKLQRHYAGNPRAGNNMTVANINNTTQQRPQQIVFNISTRNMTPEQRQYLAQLNPQQRQQLFYAQWQHQQQQLRQRQQHQQALTQNQRQLALAQTRRHQQQQYNAQLRQQQQQQNPNHFPVPSAAFSIQHNNGNTTSQSQGSAPFTFNSARQQNQGNDHGKNAFKDNDTTQNSIGAPKRPQPQASAPKIGNPWIFSGAAPKQNRTSLTQVGNQSNQS